MQGVIKWIVLFILRHFLKEYQPQIVKIRKKGRKKGETVTL